MNFSFFIHQKKRKKKKESDGHKQKDKITSAKDTFEHKEVGDFPQEWVPKPGTFLSL